MLWCVCWLGEGWGCCACVRVCFLRRGLRGVGAVLEGGCALCAVRERTRNQRAFSARRETVIAGRKKQNGGTAPRRRVALYRRVITRRGRPVRAARRASAAALGTRRSAAAGSSGAGAQPRASLHLHRGRGRGGGHAARRGRRRRPKQAQVCGRTHARPPQRRRAALCSVARACRRAGDAPVPCGSDGVGCAATTSGGATSAPQRASPASCCRAYAS